MKKQMQTYFMNKDFDELFSLLNEITQRIEENITEAFKKNISSEVKTYDVINMLESFANKEVCSFSLMFGKCLIYNEPDKLVIQFINLNEDLYEYIESKIEKVDHSAHQKVLDDQMAKADESNEEFKPWADWECNIVNEYEIGKSDEKFHNCLEYHLYTTKSTYNIVLNKMDNIEPGSKT